jgi:hypothetical protein
MRPLNYGVLPPCKGNCCRDSCCVALLFVCLFAFKHNGFLQTNFYGKGGGGGGRCESQL